MRLQTPLAALEHVGSSYGSIINLRHRAGFVVNAASDHSLESEPSNSPLKSVQGALDAFYRFSRPHTVIGTVMFINFG